MLINESTTVGAQCVGRSQAQMRRGNGEDEENILEGVNPCVWKGCISPAPNIVEKVKTNPPP